MKQAVILFAHGSRDPQWARPLRSLAARLSKKFSVRLAYLEQMRPSLDEAVGALAAAGARRVRIVPVFLGSGRHLKRDLARMTARLRRRHQDLRIRVERPVGEQPRVVTAMARAISSAISR